MQAYNESGATRVIISIGFIMVTNRQNWLISHLGSAKSFKEVTLDVSRVIIMVTLCLIVYNVEENSCRIRETIVPANSMPIELVATVSL